MYRASWIVKDDLSRSPITDNRSPMLIIPAIDLKDHKVVRLSQGKMGEAKVYSLNPLRIAEEWIHKGAKRIHCVDLNGAFDGQPKHFEEVGEIARAFPDIEIEIGGGIRDMETIDKYFNCGVSFCILGTAAINNPELLTEACKKYPGKIILGVDAKDGKVAVDGWDTVSEITAIDLAQKFKNEKIAEIIYTDISRDGMMKGLNIESTNTMASQSPFPIIASGGLTKLDEIKQLKEIKNVSGVIAGKSIYEKLFDLEDAIKITQC